MADVTSRPVVVGVDGSTSATQAARWADRRRVSLVIVHAVPLRAAGVVVHEGLVEGVRVRVDPDRLHQALGNLLDNAARYLRPGDGVTVRVRTADEAAILEVADTGPGISADELPRVFTRLWRGRAGASTAGSGTGLAVVTELVTAHGGTVTAASGAAGGSAFTIRLPSPDRRPPVTPRPGGASG